MMIIYKITNLINKKVYIGKTIQPIKLRWNAHIHNAKRRTNRYLYDSMRHYGIENFIIEEIDNAPTEEELYKKEIYWIENYKSLDKDFGYNMSDGGFGLTSKTAKKMWENPEYRKKAVERGKKRRHTPEEIEKIRLGNLGKKRSDETKKKMSESARLRWSSNEERKKQSEKRVGKILSEEHKRKISKSGKGLKRTEITKQRISAGLKGKPKSEEHKKQLSGIARIREQRKRELKNENN